MAAVEGPVSDAPTADPTGTSATASGPETAALQARLDQLEAELEAIRAGRPAGYAAERVEELPTSREYPTFNWSGFLQVDSFWSHQDSLNEATIGNIQDRTGLRRVRLRAFGDVREATTYVVDLDFAASGHPSFRDVMLRFHEWPLLQNVQFGYFQQPFSMNALTSGQELMFMERHLPFAFAPFRQTAIAANGTCSSERIIWAFSGYRFPTDSFGRSEGGSGGFAFAGRIVLLPWYRDGGDRLLHFGLGYSYGDPGDNLVQYQIQPGFFVTDSAGSAELDGGDTGVPSFVDTGPIPTHSFHLFNAELAANCGRLHLQSEVTAAVVDQRGGPTLAFNGLYAQAGYYLTGESRPYSRRRGVFRHPQPLYDFEFREPGSGAWEVAAGWSYIDLNDENVAGGCLSGLILGLNWYLNRLVKVQINYVHSLLDDPAQGESQAELAGIRAQFKF